MRSFSEIDTTAKRASKAAGFSWGIAEEIVKSISQLRYVFRASVEVEARS